MVIERKKVMDMAEKEIDGRGAGNDGQNAKRPAEPKIYASGYFYLSQQINDLRDRMDAKFDRVDTKFEVVHGEIKDLSDKTNTRFESLKKEIDSRFDKVDTKFEVVHGEIKALSDKTDAKFESMRKEMDSRFDKVDEKFDDIHKEIIGIQKWAFGLIVTVIIGFIAVYFK